MSQPANTSEHARPNALIGVDQVLGLVGVGRTAWLDRVRAKTAPQPIKMGRRTLWVESEVQGFIAEQVRRYREGGKA